MYAMKNCQNLNSILNYVVSRIVKLNLLTRKSTDKNTTWKLRKFSNNLFKQNNSVAMVTIALLIIENIPI
jgi:hypothetical protein